MKKPINYGVSLLDKKPVPAFFNMCGLEEKMSATIGRVLDHGNFSYRAFFAEESFSINLKSRFARNLFYEGPGHDYGELYNADTSYKAKVKVDWSSKGFGDWEANTGPSTIGKIAFRTSVREPRKSEVHVVEHLELELWYTFGGISASNIIISAESHEDKFSYKRSDRLARGEGRLLRIPFVKEFFWRNPGPQVSALPTEYFLNELAQRMFAQNKATNVPLAIGK